MIHSLKKALLLLPAAFIIHTADAQQSHSSKIDSYIRRANRLGMFSGNIEVIDHNKIIYKKAIGFTDASKRTPLTDQYRFHIGSIAKEFNAAGIMILKEQGKLSLDDKVSKYLTDLPAWADKISIKNLLQYTSGLPDIKWKTVNGDQDIWNDLRKLEKLDFEPGTNYAYNNNNTFLQRAIIAKISGMTFNEFVQQKILNPAGMSASIVDPTDQDPLIAKSYNNSGKQDALIYPITGWTCVTLDDFRKWSAVIAGFKLLSPASTQTIFTPVAGEDRQAGLGRGTMKDNAVVIHVHDGMAMNYQALLADDFSKGRTVILMTNNKQNNVYSLNDDIQAILEDKPYQQPRKSILNEYKGQLDTMNATRMLSLYKKLKTKLPQDYGFENPATLNEIGYSLLEKNSIADAITIFSYNTRLFPKDGNVFDSLGEAYYKKGDKKNALLNYKRSVQLSPDNDSAKAIIAALEK